MRRSPGVLKQRLSAVQVAADAMGKLAKAELRQRGRPSGKARKRQACIMTRAAETADHGPELGGSCGAGDENRTRTISLGS
jgi:hypothetical protein